MKTAMLILGLTLLGGTAQAKDHDYQQGSVTVEQVKAGTWTDTTECYGPDGAVHCSGGISEDQFYIITLTQEHGTQIHLGGMWSGNDLEKLAAFCGASCQVKYRILHDHDGVPVRILLDNGKELKFAKIKIKQEKAQPQLAQ